MEANPELEGTLRGNFDEISALQSELGGDMDSMFDDLMASLQPQSASETKCEELKKKIVQAKNSLRHRLTKIQSLDASPQKYAENFEQSMEILVTRLDGMLKKCNEIPSMQLPSKCYLKARIGSKNISECFLLFCCLFRCISLTCCCCCCCCCISLTCCCFCCCCQLHITQCFKSKY